MKYYLTFAAVIAAISLTAGVATPASAKQLPHHPRAAYNQLVEPGTVLGTDPGGLGPRQVCVDPDPNICSEAMRFYGRNSQGG